MYNVHSQTGRGYESNLRSHLMNRQFSPLLDAPEQMHTVPLGTRLSLDISASEAHSSVLFSIRR